VGWLAGASGRGAVAGAVLPEAAGGEPDDVGVIAISTTGRQGPLSGAGAGAEHLRPGPVPRCRGRAGAGAPLAPCPDVVVHGLVVGCYGQEPSAAKAIIYALISRFGNDTRSGVVEPWFSGAS
jgi:hypothetical protein